ncbi:hypothetical protein BKA69DRAFT_1109383 [Paraphysoderma sedebokerense]|nr:hypothetical protein BKA69DRAFT_1109383 [Paraphysoderma sedebokerense]
MNRLVGKTVFITGASSGIGSSCAKEFARAGSNLILVARRQERLDNLRKTLSTEFPNVKVHTALLDVRNREQVFQVVKDLPKDFQAVDVLVNNAGLVVGVEKIEDVNPNDVDTMFDTNVKGVLYVTQAVLPGMKERKRGHIINISSISATEVYPGGGVYCASKHALDAITRTLRHELLSTPLRVTSISPGAVETEFSVVRFRGDKSKADSVYQGFEPLSGDDVAEAVVFAASRRDNVQVGDILLLPTSQSSVYHFHRE